MRRRAWCGVAVALLSASTAQSQSAGDLLDGAGVRGGLVVHVGCGDGKLTAALGAGGPHLVHGLDTDAEAVAAARQFIQAGGSYGKVSVDTFDGKHLPYADNLVNLLVARKAGPLAMKEILRVLVPGGLAYVGGTRTVKPRSKERDDWTHYLHGPGGNPVADDDAVRPPKQLQWVAAPKWGRHHEHMASMHAMVSSGGKVFSICDHGPAVSMLHPPQWKLSAHDAFNGLVLWRRPIGRWFSHLHRLKSGPASLARRLVTAGGRVYVTLGIAAPVCVLDARTGKTVLRCKGTENTQEILLSGKTLFLVRGTPGGTTLTAVDAATGRILWDKPGPVSTLTLAADAKRVVFFDGRKVIALAPASGARLWTSRRLGETAKAGWTARNPPRLILTGNAVVVAPKNKVYALGADRGTVLWSAPHPRSGYVSPKDLFVIDGLVWFGETAGAPSSGRFIGRDVMTGQVKRSFLPDIDIIWLSHHRCHFSKATKNYILPGRMGVEFVDIRTEKWKQHHWVRGGCIYGVMPCNGLLYTPPHACACYVEAKQTGFAAYTSTVSRAGARPGSPRLEKGPAYGSAAAPEAKPSPSSAWPVFRHDSGRSGHTDATVPANLTVKWSTPIGGRLTQPVVEDGRVYVASIDRHTLHALDARTGKPLWQYTAGGRIDSPPSIYRGRAIFGSRDGWIYCVRGTDGRLVWRFRAMPRELLIVSYGRLESAWPVHGSVLIDNGEVHCVAGRNMFLDGGLHYLRLDPVTGRKISETPMDETDPVRGGTIQKYDSWLDMTVTLPDVLAADRTNIYMRSLPFDKKGTRRRLSHLPDEHEPARLFSPTGFLDDTWFHRTYWTYARCFPGGWVGHLAAGRYNPSGRLLVMDESTIYGYGRKPRYYRWTTSIEYRLFATPRKNQPRDIYAWDKFKAAQVKNFPRMKLDRTLKLPSGPRSMPNTPYDCTWENPNPPLHVRAVVSTGHCLFLAGPRDVVDEKDYYHANAQKGFEQLKDDLRRQADIWKGSEGAVLQAVSKKDGSRLAECRLKSLPVFDGLIATDGRLWISLADGTLTCLAGD